MIRFIEDNTEPELSKIGGWTLTGQINTSHEFNDDELMERWNDKANTDARSKSVSDILNSNILHES